MFLMAQVFHQLPDGEDEHHYKNGRGAEACER